MLYVIFIDESGIHKQVDHSTIVLVYILVKDVEKLENRIIKIEKELKINLFHWTKHGWKIRNKFFNRIKKLTFTLKVAVLRNPIKLDQALENVFSHLIIEKKIKKIIIDGEKPKRYLWRLKKILRDKGISVKKIKTTRDDSSAGIRLADALAGLIRSYYDRPDGQAKKVYPLIQDKIITTQHVGGQVVRVSSTKS